MQAAQNLPSPTPAFEIKARVGNGANTLITGTYDEDRITKAQLKKQLENHPALGGVFHRFSDGHFAFSRFNR